MGLSLLSLAKWVRIPGFAVVIFAALIGISPAQPNAISLIRDAEVEFIIRQYARPIFAAAGLDQEALNIHLVADPSLNAFVLGGQRIFINTGLLQRAEHPGQVMGVIAHEAGHVAAGHLSSLNAELRSATATTILATILGVAAGVVTENAAIGGAIQAASYNIVGRKVLSFTRGMEAAADQAAMRYLDRSQVSSEGIMEFLAILGNQSNRVVGVDPYLLTHPEPEARIAAVQTHLLLSRYTGRPFSVALQIQHERMVAKLDGFIMPYDFVMRKYRDGDRRIGARYARAIATFRRGDLASSLELVDGLLAEHPDDPYFHELKGDALFRNGHVAQSIGPFNEAVRLAPEEPLLRISLAQAQLETGRQADLIAARDHLRAAILRESQSVRAWRHLTIAYGRLGDQPNLALALAEEGFLTGDQRKAIQRAEDAVDLFPAGSPGQLRAQDLLQRIHQR
ncbi:MAG: M48 family metalloprotease [Alphaproteobacteria bacterium]|nr:M48 family metalloprotease [Alphaproteobacteria bacterium]